MRWQVGKFAAKGRPIGPDELEELRAQGIMILYEIHAKWDPSLCAKFSAYAISLFQLRMIDWHRKEITSSCRGHRKGKSAEIQYHGIVSIDAPQEVMQTFSQDPALVHYDAVS